MVSSGTACSSIRPAIWRPEDNAESTNLEPLARAVPFGITPRFRLSIGSRVKAVRMLHECVTFNRTEIIKRCKARVSTRPTTGAAEPDIEQGVPLFLDQLVQKLRFPDTTVGEIGVTASKHGHDLLLKGFSVSQVVHDYGDICQSITELAVEGKE